MIYIFLCIVLILFPKSAFNGAFLGVDLTLKSVIPSLFPFSFASSMLIKSGYFKVFDKLFYPFSYILFSSKNASTALLSGLLGGYPCGAGAVFKLYSDNIIEKDEAEYILSFSNCGGLIFAVSFIGNAFSNRLYGLYVFVSQIFGVFLASLIMRIFREKKKSQKPPDFLNRSSFSFIVNECMTDSLVSMAKIFGFIVFFSAVTSALNLSNHPFLSGLLEMTNGISLLSKGGVRNLPLVAFLFTFGGLCVHCQVLSVLEKTDLSLKKYFVSKIISAFFAFWVCFLLLNFE